MKDSFKDLEHKQKNGLHPQILLLICTVDN